MADLQAYAHLARYVAVRYPAFANEAVALLCDIFRLREAVVESLEVVGRVSVKDASGIDIRRNCIEVLLVTDPCKMTRNRVGRSNLTPRSRRSCCCSVARRHCLVSTLCVVLSRISRSISRFFATLHRR